MPMLQPDRSQTDQLETLSAISRALSATLDLRQLCETVAHEIGQVMDTTMFYIAILEANGTSLWMPYVHDKQGVYRDVRVPYGSNVTSVVLREGHPLLFPTYREYRSFAEQHGLPTLKVGEDLGESALFVPLHTGTRCLGVISVQSFQPDVYTAVDVETLTVLAAQTAIAIENAELFERSRQSVRRMSALLHVAHTINQSLDLTEVMDAVLVSMQEVIPYAFAAVLLANESEGTLDIMGSMGREGPHLTTTLRIPFGEGVSGAVYRSGEPLLVPDVRQFPGFIDHGLQGVLSELAVPLRWGDRVIGVLNIGRDGTNAFHEDELDPVSLFAAQAAVALEHARLYAAQRQRVDELQTIESIVQQVQSLHDIPAIARLVAGELKRLIDYHACRLYVTAPDGQSLQQVQTEPGVRTGGPLSIQEGFAGWIVREARADRIASSLDDPRPVHIPGTPEREESLVGAPLIFEDRVRGVIALSKLGRDQFDENDVRVLQIVAAQVAIALDRVRLYGELHMEARTDGLVRLWNRRHLIERFREERSRAARSGRPLSAIMFDIDRFKRVNDAYGHDAGDLVLREVASLLRAGTRAEDIVARYGGEEFVALLPACDATCAAALADRLCRTVAGHTMPAGAGVDRVTVSAGVAEWNLADVGEELFSRADAAMYLAKGAGGNRVEIIKA